MIDFTLLSRIGEEIDIEQVSQLNALFTGNFQSGRFNNQHPYEPAEIFKHNQQYAQYENHFRRIITNITTRLFENEIFIKSETNAEYIGRLNDCLNLKDLLAKICQANLIYSSAYISVLPKLEIANSLLEEERLNLDIPDVEIIENISVVNYTRNKKTGKFSQFLTRTLEVDQELDILEPKRCYYQFKIYRQLSQEQTELKVYETERFDPRTIKTAPTEYKDQVSKVWDSLAGIGNQQTISPLLIEQPTEEIIYTCEFPIHELKFKIPIELGNQIKPIAIKLFQLDSAYYGALHRALNPIPTLYQEPVSSLDKGFNSIAAETENANPLADYKSNSYLKLSSGSKAEYLSPPSENIITGKDTIDVLISRMYEMAWESAQKHKKTHSGVQSGVSKAIDEKQRDVIISYIATTLKADAMYILHCIAKIFNIDDDYTVEGIDYTSDMIHREDLITEAVQSGVMPIIMQSPTFRNLYASKIASSFLNNMVPPAMMENIAKEIEGIEYEEPKEEKQMKETNAADL